MRNLTSKLDHYRECLRRTQDKVDEELQDNKHVELLTKMFHAKDKNAPAKVEEEDKQQSGSPVDKKAWAFVEEMKKRRQGRRLTSALTPRMCMT